MIIAQYDLRTVQPGTLNRALPMITDVRPTHRYKNTSVFDEADIITPLPTLLGRELGPGYEGGLICV